MTSQKYQLETIYDLKMSKDESFGLVVLSKKVYTVTKIIFFKQIVVKPVGSLLHTLSKNYLKI